MEPRPHRFVADVDATPMPEVPDISERPRKATCIITDRRMISSLVSKCLNRLCLIMPDRAPEPVHSAGGVLPEMPVSPLNRPSRRPVMTCEPVTP